MDLHPVVRQGKYNTPGDERCISQNQTQIILNQLNSQAPENETLNCQNETPRLAFFKNQTHRGEHFMAYTPELSQQSSCTLRRIAWALEIPMTKAMERIFDHIPMIVDTNKICLKCQDKTKCRICIFNNKNLTNGG